MILEPGKLYKEVSDVATLYIYVYRYSDASESCVFVTGYAQGIKEVAERVNGISRNSLRGTPDNPWVFSVDQGYNLNRRWFEATEEERVEFAIERLCA